MARYGVPVLGLAMGGILLYASIVNCGWVLSAEPARYCGESPVAQLVQVLGTGIVLGAISALVGVYLGADVVCRGWYNKMTGRLSAASSQDADDSQAS